MSRPVYEAGREAVRSLRNGDVANAGKCAIYARRKMERARSTPELNSMDVFLDWREGMIDGLLES